jgi:hypothetical protein
VVVRDAVANSGQARMLVVPPHAHVKSDNHIIIKNVFDTDAYAATFLAYSQASEHGAPEGTR